MKNKRCQFVTTRIEPEVLELINKLGFDSRSQFIRFAIRFTLRKLLEGSPFQKELEYLESVKKIGSRARAVSSN